MADVQEVSNYVAALEHGLKRLSDGFPLSLRLIREMHEILLARGRGSLAASGEFRRSQNRIEGISPNTAYFVPPPAEFIQKCLGELENFLHDLPQATSPLLKATLAHVQFETIHPFLDGNERIGRLLITLILCEQKVLQQPLLYISLYFKTHRMYYYELLNNVRTTGDWESWLIFFTEAVTDTATQAVKSINLLAKMAEKNEQAINTLGRARSSAQTLHQAILQRPIVSASWLVENTNLTPATVNKNLTHLESLGIVKQLGDKRRNRMFAYTEYMDILGI